MQLAQSRVFSANLDDFAPPPSPLPPFCIVVSASHHVDVNEISNFNLRGRIVLIVYGRRAELFAITVDYLFNYLHYIRARAHARTCRSSCGKLCYTPMSLIAVCHFSRGNRGGCAH